MRRFLILTWSMLLMQLRDRTTLFWNFAFPVGLITLYGAIWGQQEMGGMAAISWLMVGSVVLNIMAAGFIGDSSWLSLYRQKGVLLRLRATPLPASMLVGSYGLVRVLLAMLQSVLIVAVAILGFGATLEWSGLLLGLPVASFGALVFLLMGQAIAGISPSQGASVAIGQMLYFPLMFLSNLFMPLEALPDWAAGFARWTPAFMLVDLLRPMLLPVEALQSAWINGLGLLIYGAIGMFFAALLFRWEPRR